MSSFSSVRRMISSKFSLFLLPSLARVLIGVLIMVPLTTFYLDPKDFGVLAIITVITGAVLPLVSTGASWVLGANFFRVSDIERKELLFAVIVVEFILRIVFVGALWAIADWLLPRVIENYSEEFGLYFRIHLATVLCTVFWPIVSFVLVTQHRASLHAVMEIGQLLVLLGGSYFLLAILGQKGITLFLAPLAASVLSLMVEIAILRKEISPFLKKNWIIEIWKVGMPSIPANTAEALSNSSDRYFVQKFASLEALGIYAHSQTYATVFKTVNKAFARTINPPALKAFSAGQDARFLVAQFRIWFSLLALAGLGAVFFSRDLLALLTHNKFTDAAPLVVVWVFLMVCHSVGIPNALFLLSKKATGELAYLQTTISVAFIGVTAAATYFFGIYGACISIVASNLTLQIAYVLRARKMGCQYRDSGFALMPAILIIACAVVEYFWQPFFYQRVLFVIFSACAVAGYVRIQLKALADGQALPSQA